MRQQNIPKKNKRPPELQVRINKTRTAAHKEVVQAGKIQFRLDLISMERLLKIADTKRTGAGVLARMWVVERLESESLGVQLRAQDSQLYSHISKLEQRIKLLESARKRA